FRASRSASTSRLSVAASAGSSARTRLRASSRMFDPGFAAAAAARKDGSVENGAFVTGGCFRGRVTGGLAVPCSIKEYAPTPASSTRTAFGGSSRADRSPDRPPFRVRIHRLGYSLPFVPYILFVTNVRAWL